MGKDKPKTYQEGKSLMQSRTWAKLLLFSTLGLVGVGVIIGLDSSLTELVTGQKNPDFPFQIIFFIPFIVLFAIAFFAKLFSKLGKNNEVKS